MYLFSTKELKGCHSRRWIKTLQFFLFICPLFLLNAVTAQDFRQTELNKLIDSIRSYNQSRNIEKIYAQLDKPHYLSSDTIWFKAYVFEAAYLKNSTKSGLIYVEIASDSNKVVKRMMLPVVIGVTWGNIALNADDFPEGTYTFRAYTNWMRNFGDDYIFSKTFSISNPGQKSWLVNSRMSLSNTEGKDMLGLSLQFRDLDQAAVGLRAMRVRVIDGKRIIYRADKETSLYGDLDLQLNLPEKTDPNSISVITEDLRKGEGNRKVNIPLPINRAKNIDLQFMPEGGHLVAGLISDVAFKAIAEDGKGINLSGTILDSKMQEVTVFSSSHKGMGTFTLAPTSGETYLARAILPDGSKKDYAIPLAKSSGTVIKVVNRLNNQSLDVLIQSSPDLVGSNSFYRLIAQTNGVIYYAASVALKQAVIRVRIDKDLFASGMARLSLLNAANVSLNERMVYISRKDNLDIGLSFNKSVYSTRDSISMGIQVRDRSGNPIAGSFSVSVTDDNRVKTDSLNSNNILSSMFITSGLKGTVEDPGYYFNSADSTKAWEDLDKLLLTQGWVSFSWPEVFTPKKPMLYPAESEFTVNGRVTNMFNKGVGNTGLVLFSKKPLVLIDTLTDANGRFSFRNLPQADTAIYVIQSRNKRGGNFNVGIEVDEFVPPVFSPVKERFTPWFINSDTTFLKSTKSIVKEQHRYDAPVGVNVLDEVVVTAKKIIPLSRNKNGSGNADFIMDEKEMQAARKMTLFEVLEKRFPGFRRTSARMLKESHDTIRYVLLNSVVNLVIDGVNVREIGSEEDLYMNYLTAEDITGIEIMKSSKYGSAYDTDFIRKQIGCMRCPPPPIFIELTTRSGNGAFLKKTAGIYLYKPLAYSFPKDFYRPRYIVKEANPPLADLRPTIHWEPNIITGKDGKARISFYSADQSGNYTVILEGTDMNGSLGYARGRLTIDN